MDTAPQTEPMTPPDVRRRDVLAYGAGAAAVGAALTAATRLPASAATPVRRLPGVLDLHINAGFVPMVDGSLVYMRGYGDRHTELDDPAPSLTTKPSIFLASGKLVRSRLFPTGARRPVGGRPLPLAIDPGGVAVHTVRRQYWGSIFPRRTIVAQTGSRIRLRIFNHLSQPHRFVIPGVKGARSGVIPPGGVARLSFLAPRAGTYIYRDPSRGAVERVLGLHGVLVVVPRQNAWRLVSGGAEFERQWLWICHDIDPEWGRLARAGRPINPARTPLLPRYFTINDRSGFQSMGVTNEERINLASHEETLPSGSARATDVRNFAKGATANGIVTGQLVRLVNTGVAVHQLHWHGNHVWTLRRDNQAFSRRTATVDARGHVLIQQWEDVVELDPLQSKEIMLPLRPPGDALEEVREAQDCDWHFPMHCHAEMSQSAGGGLYPGGMVADWMLAAPMRHEEG